MQITNDQSPINCQSAESEHGTCNSQVCSSDCITSGWSVWGHCDCKTEKKSRSRQVLKWPSHGGKECEALTEVTDCPENCLQHCTVGDWSEWTECSATCGYSQASRKRQVLKPVVGQGNVCPTLVLTRQCPLFECPTNRPFGTPRSCYHLDSLCHLQSDGVYSNPRSACSPMYLNCINHEELWNKCPDDLVYSAERQRCETPDDLYECQALSE